MAVSPEILAFHEKLVTFLSEHVEYLSDGRASSPVVIDYVLVAAIDDMSDVGEGGLSVQVPPGTFTYRTVGLLELAKETHEAEYGDREAD